MDPEISSKTQTREGELLDHSYDGIQEFDNPMPRWWVWIFWGTFWFSLAYLFHYTVGNGVGVNATHEAEVLEAKAEQAKNALTQQVSEEALAQTLADAGSVSAGRAVFIGKCAACHAEGGQGLSGPNLTDAAWVHGKGTLLDIYGVVAEGVAAKGMPAWAKQLSPAELRQVVAFVGSIRGSNVPGKPPEGIPTE